MSSHVDAATLRLASTAYPRVPHTQRAGRNRALLAADLLSLAMPGLRRVAGCLPCSARPCERGTRRPAGRRSKQAAPPAPVTTEAGSIDERGDPRHQHAARWLDDRRRSRLDEPMGDAGPRLHAWRLRRRRARPPDPRRRRPRRDDRGAPHLRPVGAVVGPRRADRPRPRTRVSHHARRFRRITRGWRRHNRRRRNRADARAGNEGRRQQRRHRDGRRPDRPSVSPRRAHRRALDAGGWLRDLAPRLALAWMRRCCSSAIATAQPLVLFDGGRWRERARLPFSG
jgi:hypothetical protein